MTAPQGGNPSIALLANPRSGGGDAPDVEAELRSLGVEVQSFAIDKHHAAAQAGAERIVVAGGDGSIGSAASAATVNFDNRSFQLHDEVTLCVFGEQFAGKLEAAAANDLGSSDRIYPGRWDRRGPLQRVAQSASKLLRRML